MPTGPSPASAGPGHRVRSSQPSGSFQGDQGREPEWGGAKPLLPSGLEEVPCELGPEENIKQRQRQCLPGSVPLMNPDLRKLPILQGAFQAHFTWQCCAPAMSPLWVLHPITRLGVQKGRGRSTPGLQETPHPVQLYCCLSESPHPVPGCLLMPDIL